MIYVHLHIMAQSMTAVNSMEVAHVKLQMAQRVGAHN